MKTIAVMTMAFLPATFLAALFSVSTLWSESGAVTNRFWIYWACTLITTAAVFIVWGMFSKRNSRQSFRSSYLEEGRMEEVLDE